MAASSKNLITIEENARFMLNSNTELITDAHISNALICTSPQKQHSGYQPLLSPQQHGSLYIDTIHDEDVLLNPVRHKSTMSIIGPASSFLDAEEVTISHQRSTFCHTPHSNNPFISPAGQMPSSVNGLHGEWTTSNWTSIFLHFHSVEHSHYVYPSVTIIGILVIIGMLFTEYYLIRPTHIVLAFCRYLDWVLMVMFCYLFAFVISYSRSSTKKWCILRDELYVLFWVNSVCSRVLSQYAFQSQIWSPSGMLFRAGNRHENR